MTLLPQWASLMGLGLLAGFAAGLAHFATLHLTVRLLVGGTAIKALALQLGRLGLLGLVFVALARLGAPALIASAMGLLLARQVLVTRVKTGESHRGRA